MWLRGGAEQDMAGRDASSFGRRHLEMGCVTSRVGGQASCVAAGDVGRGLLCASRQAPLWQALLVPTVVGSTIKAWLGRHGGGCHVGVLSGRGDVGVRHVSGGPRLSLAYQG